MDERKLGELFRDAASVTPPASFDEQDVVRGSHRVTARRRMAVAGGSLATAAVLIGVGVGTGIVGGPSDSGDPIALPPSTSSDAPRTSSSNGQQPMSLPNERSAASCGEPDPELGRALAEQVPELDSTAPVPARGHCVPGSRSVSFVLHGGRITAFLAPGTIRDRPREHSDGTLEVARPAPGGGTLLLLSSPERGDPALNGERLSAVATDLADQL